MKKSLQVLVFSLFMAHLWASIILSVLQQPFPPEFASKIDYWAKDAPDIYYFLFAKKYTLFSWKIPSYKFIFSPLFMVWLIFFWRIRNTWGEPSKKVHPPDQPELRNDRQAN